MTMPALLAWTGGVLGAVLGSFAGVLQERLRDGRSLGGRSTCVCGRQLRAVENIPVLGWLAVAGRARCCRTRIPARYLTWEVVSAAAGAVAGLLAGPVGIGVAAGGVVGAGLVAGHLGRKRTGRTTPLRPS